MTPIREQRNAGWADPPSRRSDPGVSAPVDHWKALPGPDMGLTDRHVLCYTSGMMSPPTYDPSVSHREGAGDSMPAHRPVPRHRQGFSILEVTVAMSIVAVVLSSIVGSMVNLFDFKEKSHNQQIAMEACVSMAEYLNALRFEDLRNLTAGIRFGGDSGTAQNYTDVIPLEYWNQLGAKAWPGEVIFNEMGDTSSGYSVIRADIYVSWLDRQGDEQSTHLTQYLTNRGR
jgi:prepilin-type N-terminal cleavage/methylation domain-containing protein